MICQIKNIQIQTQSYCRLTVLAQEIDADLQVSPFELAVDCLAAVVEESRADGDVAVETDFLGHDPCEVGNFLRVVQHVLPIARSIFRRPVASAARDAGRACPARTPPLRRLPDRLFHSVFTSRRLPRYGPDGYGRRQSAARWLVSRFPAIQVEARQDDRARRVVDNEIDPRGLFERANVTSFAADDAPLQIVARQVHDRDRRLRGVLGGAALNGFGDVLARLRGGLLAGFGSRRFTRFAASRRASASMCFSSSSLASSVVNPDSRSSSCCCAATSCSYFGRGGRALSRSAMVCAASVGPFPCARRRTAFR